MYCCHQALFAIFILISGSVRSQTNDLFSTKERLYDPDLFSSLYKETSRRDRLYLVPGITNVKRELENDSFDFELINKPHKDEVSSGRPAETHDGLRRLTEINEDASEDDVTNFNQAEDVLNLREGKSENDMKGTDEMVPKLLSDDLVSMVTGGQNAKTWRTKYFRAFVKPKVRRTLRKVPSVDGRSSWAQRKRYKAGVVDRIAHGFGKRSQGSVNVDDLIQGILGDLRLTGMNELLREYTKTGGESQRPKENSEFKHVENLIEIMDNYKEKQRNDKMLIKPSTQSLDDIIEAYINTHGSHTDVDDDPNHVL